MVSMAAPSSDPSLSPSSEHESLARRCALCTARLGAATRRSHATHVPAAFALALLPTLCLLWASDPALAADARASKITREPRRAWSARTARRVKDAALLLAVPTAVSLTAVGAIGIAARFDRGESGLAAPALVERERLRQLEHAGGSMVVASTARITIANRFDDHGHTALRIEYPGVDRTYDYGAYAPGPQYSIDLQGPALMRVWNDHAAFLRAEAAYSPMTVKSFALRPSTALLIETRLREAFDLHVSPRSTTDFVEYRYAAGYHVLKRNCTLTIFNAVAAEVPALREAARGLNDGRGLSLVEKLSVVAGGWPEQVFTPRDLDAALRVFERSQAEGASAPRGD